MNRIKSGLIVTLINISGATIPVVSGQTIQVNQQSAYSVEKPKTGLSMQQVESKYGSPAHKLPAVGDPPITRWQYSSFTVYFEHDRVIHAVAHRS
ncbi:hypothetical protein [Aliikangiella maris]|uniref:Uncharacterized protein n=2 Tax=Aliikangiella maris TaxID=3162458 RepID=A0ABV3MIJ4_9GAMM